MLDELRDWVSFVVIVATILALAFPALYSTTTWNQTTLGRLLMADSLAYAFIMVVAVVFRFYRPVDTIAPSVWYLVAFSFVLVTNGALLWILWRMHFKKEKPRD